MGIQAITNEPTTAGANGLRYDSFGLSVYLVHDESVLTPNFKQLEHFLALGINLLGARGCRWTTETSNGEHKCCTYYARAAECGSLERTQDRRADD